MGKKAPCDARIFAGNQVAPAQSIDSPQRYVAKIANWRGDNVEAGGIQFGKL